jgi:hypothetical protein
MAQTFLTTVGWTDIMVRWLSCVLINSSQKSSRLMITQV